VKTFPIALKILLFVTPILLIGDIVFAFLALRFSNAYLISEMERTLVGFSQTVALDISRSYEVSNSRSLYSLLDELRRFDPRIVRLSVIDSAFTITADLETKQMFGHDSSEAIRSVIRSHEPLVGFDEERRLGITTVPILASRSGTLLGIFRAYFSIEELYQVVHSLRVLIIEISIGVFVFLATGMLLFTRKVIVRPLRTFLPILDSIERGDYAVTVPVKGNDEIGILARNVDRMAAGLKEREFVKDTFSRYVPKEVVNRLLQRKIRPRLEGEMRTVTIFFCDIRGFTHMTERLGAEQIVRLLNRYFTVMTDVTIEHDGMIDKFSGDEIMVVFGTPIARDDDPIRAVRMGLAMKEKLKELNEQLVSEGREPIAIGAGIATGVAIAGNVGSEKRLNYSVIGDVVNLASRLTSKARAGEIIISASTYELVREHFVCSPLGKVEVKGKAEPVEMFLVTGESRT
jgi:class 3 adenylate cyclase